MGGLEREKKSWAATTGTRIGPAASHRSTACMKSAYQGRVGWNRTNRLAAIRVLRRDLHDDLLARLHAADNGLPPEDDLCRAATGLKPSGNNRASTLGAHTLPLPSLNLKGSLP